MSRPPKNDVDEVGYLGCGSMLSLGGWLFPNGRVASVLSDASLTKALLLLFDRLVVSGGTLVPQEDESVHLSPWPLRPSGSFEGDLEVLNRLRITTPVDVVAGQLAEVGCIEFAKSTTLFSDTEIASFLEIFVEFACDAPRSSRPLSFDEGVFLDPGPLGPFMREDLVLWTMEELQRVGLAAIKETGSLIRYERPDGEFDEGGSTTLFAVDPYVADAFSLAANQMIERVGARVGVGLHALRASPGVLVSGDERTGGAVPTVAQLIELEATLVGLNLDAVPLDEILGFRESHASARRAMLRRLRLAVADLAIVDDTIERHRRLAEYRAELEEMANGLATAGRRAFGRGVRDVILGGGGIAGGLATGNPIASLLSAAQALHAVEGRRSSMGPMTYFMAARQQIPYW